MGISAVVLGGNIVRAGACLLEGLLIVEGGNVIAIAGLNEAVRTVVTANRAVSQPYVINSRCGNAFLGDISVGLA